MRSPKEILFRLRQEARNLQLWRGRPPDDFPEPVTPLAQLPDPETVAVALRGTAWAARTVELAEAVLTHHIPVFDRFVETDGAAIDWRRDYERRISSELRYFRRVPYLDVAQVGDHKNVWELNRHQHLVLLAQAFALTKRSEFIDELVAQLESWLVQNPLAEGINWASALEVAFRALSWVWIWHLIGSQLPADWRRRFLVSLFQHGQFLENNFSIYFSPNTHLLGEAVALHALGTFFPSWPDSARWREYGGHWVIHELNRQVQPDGMHFEQSTYYHVYAFDMFLFHAVIADVDAQYRGRLDAMARVLSLLLGKRGALPFLGDDDGGRFFYPYGPRDQFGRASLVTHARILRQSHVPYGEEAAHDQSTWWLGPLPLPVSGAELPLCTDLPNAGLIIWNAPEVQIILDAGPFGAGSAGHSHADAGSLVVTAGEEELLIDPGTYTYVGDPAQRNFFRSSPVHNTMWFLFHEQALPAGPFRWTRLPAIARHLDASERASTTCISFRGEAHMRRVRFTPPYLLVVDECSGQNASISWHAGVPVARLGAGAVQLGKRARLLSTAPLTPHTSSRSRTYGQMETTQMLQARVLNCVASVIDLSGTASKLNVRQNGDEYEIIIDGKVKYKL